jgi:hypothetical protein
MTLQDTPSILGLEVAALQNVLSKTDLWYDFSKPEWQLRVGELLWSTPMATKLDTSSEKEIGPTASYILLLQVLLSSELLIRLGLTSDRDYSATEYSMNEPPAWNLELARTFLTNLEIALIPDEHVNFSLDWRELEQSLRIGPELTYQPKRIGFQISALFEFAETLQWPNLEQLRKDIISQSMALLRSYPATFKATNSGASAIDLEAGIHKLPYHVRLYDRYRSDRSTVSTESGWLTRTWLSGLAMTDEIASALVMATLLETSPDALDVLGVEADLQGALVHQGRAYWSRWSKVSGMLKAGEEVKECFGWASAPCTEESGWLVDMLPVTMDVM